jgi:hypothetical protein
MNTRILVPRRRFLAALSAGGALASRGFSHPADGFRPLFNGKNLDEWDADAPTVWEVRDGAIIGRAQGLAHNEFLRTKSNYSDFTLKLQIRLINGKGNSGVQFRSKPVPNSHGVSGYQADAGDKYWGALYDESRRNKILASPKPEFLEKFDPAAWHSYAITAKGNRIRLEMDGVTTVEYEEKEPGIPQTGIIALQVHGGPHAMEVWFKDLMIKV